MAEETKSYTTPKDSQSAPKFSVKGALLVDDLTDLDKKRGLPYTTALCAQYGHAITVHKSQGSQWNTEALIDDWVISDDRWE